MAKAINTGKAGADPLETLQTMEKEKDSDYLKFTEDEKRLLKDLLDNASIGYHWYYTKFRSPDTSASLASRAR
jgi:hypothetical protein